MNKNFDSILNNAMRRCEGLFVKELYDKFQTIYPFTTENISGYINLFNLKDKKLLLVGSSGDQVINAILNGCYDITVFDINSYAKFYYYLKITAILTLEIDEFLTFFRYKDFPKVFKDNNDVLNKKTYYKLKSKLRLLDYESYLFWDELFESFTPLDIRNRMFSNDEDRTDVIRSCNNYLSSKESYYTVREKIKVVKPKFINGDLFEDNIEGEYDSIWLSNIGTYVKKMEKLKDLVYKMKTHLKKNGKLLIVYLYTTKRDTIYRSDWSSIYDLDKTFDILYEYNPYLVSFTGIKGLIFKDDSIKDSVLICDNN